MAKFFSALFILLFSFPVFGANPNFHAVTPSEGEGIFSLLRKYQLLDNTCNLNKFYELNNLKKGDNLISGKKYILPVMIYDYDGKSIRSTINIDDYKKALRIQKFNENIFSRGLRQTHFTESKILWVPFHELECAETVSTPEEIKVNKTVTKNHVYEPLFGKKYADIKVEDNSLYNQVYYIVSGHGGPDPGALCDECPTTLCEDEYAYDVAARLARNLKQHGAIVHMIVQDKNDGIRDDQILICDKDERVNGKRLPLNQLERLKQRSVHVNQLYSKHKKQGVKSQKAIVIHVDARNKGKRQDVFFYHYRYSNSGKKLAYKMKNVFQSKYKKYQKNRGYKGYVEGKGLYVLRTMAPTTLFIELANIKNKSDHKRLLLNTNRQALANWLFEGLTR